MFGIIESISEPIVKLSSLNISDLKDALLVGGGVLLLGTATVFAVLCILWLFIVLFRLCFHELPKLIKKRRKKVAPTLVPVQSVTETKSKDEKEIIAVIAAAIAMAESEGSGMKFKVVSFRRV